MKTVLPPPFLAETIFQAPLGSQAVTALLAHLAHALAETSFLLGRKLNIPRFLG